MTGIVAARQARTQSLTSGNVTGTVQDSLGIPLREAIVTLIDLETGVRRSVTTSGTGRFRFDLLAPGEYDINAERLGYRPMRVRGVPVRPGQGVDVGVALAAAAPPVTRVDSMMFPASLEGVGTGAGEWFGPLALSHLPDGERQLSDVTRLSTEAVSGTEFAGLPVRLSGAYIDGLPYAPAVHPALALPSIDGASVPLSGFDRAELITNGLDGEWSGFSGSYLGGLTRRPSQRLSASLFGDWSGDALSSSKYYDTNASSHSTIRGGAVISGPLVRDTAGFVVGIEAARDQTPLPPAWTIDSLDARLLTVARDSFGADLSAYTRPRIAETSRVAGFGRFDWQITAGHRLSVRGNAATISGTNPTLGSGHTAGIGATLSGTDFSTGATLESSLSSRMSQELRVGVDGSVRRYDSTGLPATTLVDAGLAFGTDPAFPAHFRQLGLRLSDALFMTLGSHALKAGVTGTLTSYVQTYVEGSEGAFIFAGPTDFASRHGVFAQTTGSVPDVQYSMPRFGAYLQDTWTATPGLDLVFGVRVDLSRLPRNNVAAIDTLRTLTGLDNRAFPSSLTNFGPRFGFTWDVDRRQHWIVRGGLGVYEGSVDPALLGEITTQGGQLTDRQGVGNLKRYPNPDSTAAPLVGPSFTLLDPSFAAPRSVDMTVGLARSLGGTAALTLAGTYRHTDFLPRRHDLNLLSAPTATDQYGRPIYGTLEQLGSVLAVAPGSNRRFPEFDHIWSLDPDGVSNYWGATITFERQVSHGLRVLASYTYSRTTDNWLASGLGGIGTQVTPFADSLNGRDWADGRSDLDVPHRVSIGAELALPGRLAPRLAVLYRYQSGYPYTPGFRTGVDANGDGSASNDPAFVDTTVAGTSALVKSWSCLASQVRRFVDRNSCRSPGVQHLDLRASLTGVRLGAYPVDVVIDAINVLESDVGVIDAALYLVDGSRTLTTNSQTGRVTVPLVANNHFGQLLVRQTTGRFVRVGLRVNY